MTTKQLKLSKEKIWEINKNLKPRGLKMCNHCQAVYALDENNYRKVKGRKEGQWRWRYTCLKCENRAGAKKMSLYRQDPVRKEIVYTHSSKWLKNNREYVNMKKRERYHQQKLTRILEKYGVNNGR